ncbi:MAG: DUF5698 domain-containing protein [Anaerolineae bacterium]|nr:DUF5698 domain-containing protein [Anaerolineae bacterium]
MDPQVLGMAGLIFGLRVLGNMVTTLRLVMLVRGQRAIVAAFATVESLIFALALGTVVNDLHNVLNLTAYCTGFAMGGYLGMELERHLVQRFVAIHIISPRKSHAIAVAIRKAGCGATESWGQGADGQVGIVQVVVSHRQVRDVTAIVERIDDNAFITLEELRGISHGYFRRSLRQER